MAFDPTDLSVSEPGAAATLTVIQIEQLKREILATTPFASFEYVDVVFGTANADRDIRTRLTPANPENIDYRVVKADRATTIYNDQSGTRHAWKRGYIVLRSSTASAVVTLLLTTRRTS